MKPTPLPISQRSLFDPPRMSWTALPPDPRSQAVEHMAQLLVQMFRSLRSCQEIQERERQD